MKLLGAPTNKVIVGLLIVIVAFGAYFFLHVRNVETQLTDHYLRNLDIAGDRVGEVLQGLLTNVQNAAAIDTAEIDTAVIDREIETDAIEELRKSIQGHEGPAAAQARARWQLRFSRAIEDRRKLIQDLEAYTDSVPKWVERFSKYPSLASYPAKNKTSLRVTLDNALGGTDVVFVFSRPELDAKPKAWRARLRRVLLKAMPIGPGQFESVLLVHGDGEVLFGANSSSSHLRVTRLTLPAVKGEKASEVMSPQKLALSDVRDLTIAGSHYKLFLHPVRIPIMIHQRSQGDSAWLERNWFIAGLLPARQLRTESTAIPPFIVLGAFGAILLLSLSLPVLRVRFLGAREELRHVDIGAQAAAIVLGSSIATFLVLYAVAYIRDARATDARLRNLSMSIEQQLVREIDQMDSTLVELTEVRIKRDSSTDTLSRLKLLADGSVNLESPPFLDLAFWISESGKSTARWSIRSTPTPVVNVGSRPYFSEPKRGNLWPAPPYSRFGQGRFVQGIRSLTTGREAAVLSRTYDSLGSDSRNFMAAIESRMRSVIGPVLPKGQGFAIVDTGGGVQFHSDRSRISENLYRELDSDLAVRASVAARQEIDGRTSFRMVPRVFRVHALPDNIGIPWVLVVFEDEDQSYSWQVETLLLSVIVFGVYCMAFLLAALIVLGGWRAASYPGEPRRLWYWPAGSRRAVVLLRWFRGVAVVWVLAFVTGVPWLILLVSVAAPLAALVKFRVTLESNPPEEAPPEPSNRTYVFAVTLMVIVIGVLPAIGIFRVVHDEVQLRALQSQQADFAGAIANRWQEQEDWYRDVHWEDRYRQQIARSVHGTSSADSAIGYHTPLGWSWSFTADRQMAGKSPRMPITSAVRAIHARWGLPAVVAAPIVIPAVARNEWRQSRTDTVHCLARGLSFPAKFRGVDPEPSTGREVLSMSAVPLRLGLVTDGMFLFLGILGLSGLYWIVRVSVESTFLSGPQPMGPQPVVFLEAVPGEPQIRKLALPWLLPEDKKPPHLHVIGIQDVRKAQNVAALMKGVDAAIHDEARKPRISGVLLTQFDYGLKESDIICRKLELLEALNACDEVRVICIESWIEPLRFLTAKHRDHYAEREKLGIDITRWAAALQHFDVIRVPADGANPGDLAHVARNQNDSIVALRVEGKPTRVLGRMEKRLLSRVDLQSQDRKDVALKVLELAQAHYRRLWAACSSEEKLLLYRVAREGLVNRRAKDVLRPLLAMGLVRMDPGCRLMNDSFRIFVLNAERPEVFAKWQERGRPGLWSRMRTPILLALGTLAVFFFATQREALSQTLALLTAIAAFAPSLVSSLGGLARSRQPVESKPEVAAED